MRERHIFWDIAPLLVLSYIALTLTVVFIDSQRNWNVIKKLEEEQKKQVEQYQRMQTLIRTIADRPVNVVGPQTAHGGTNGDGAADEIKPPVLPDFVRGDENAEDGGTIVDTISEPNSLNPIIENDSAVSSLFGRANDSLVTRSWDDLSLWEPQLAWAWTQELACTVYTQEGDAAKLVADLKAKWNAETLKKFKIKSITAEGADAVRIDIHDVDNSYAERLKQDFGARVLPQWWFYVNFKGIEFTDGRQLTPRTIGAWVQRTVEAIPDFKGRLLPVWTREDSVVLMVLGGEDARDQVDKALKALVASPENKALVLAQGTTSGKKEEPCLSYDIMEDYFAHEKPVFTYYLRKDVRWHDGEPFSGRDVVFSFNTIMNPKVEAGPNRNYFQDCNSCELVDDNPHVVRFVWNKPYFAAFDSTCGINIMAEHAYRFDDATEFNTSKKNQEILGTGPYKLIRWEKTQEFVFERNEDYYGRKPHIKKYVLKIVKDPTVRLKLLEAGDLDYLGMTATQMAEKEKDPAFMAKFTVNKSISNVYRYIGWNARQPYFKDKKVRQALTQLVDRERIAESIFRGYVSVHHGSVHPEAPGYWKGIEKVAYKFDPKAARQQLAEAGWVDTDNDGVLDKDGVPFKFTLLIVANSAEYEATANMIKEEFARSKIVVSINNLEWSAFLQKIERLKFDACILGWSLGLIGDPYQLWHSSQTDEKESNFCNFVNPEADRLIERFRRTLDDTKRNKMLERFQQIIHDEQPYTFLFVPKRLVAYDPRIKNVKYILVGADQNRWWIPASEQRRK